MTFAKISLREIVPPTLGTLHWIAAGLLIRAIVGICPAIAQETNLRPQFEISWEQGHPDLSQNKLFASTDGWIGGDGFQSLRLDSNRILWLFSDTWIGRIENHRRVDATIVNNTVAIQSGTGESATNQFYVRQNEEGKPVAFITPKDGVGWFWLQAGIKLNGKLYLFLTQVDRTSGTGIFAFKIIGQSLGVVSNPDADPMQWKIVQSKITCSSFDDEREIAWGNAILEQGQYFYLYGSDEDVYPNYRDRHLVIARVLKDSLPDFSRWEFYGEQGWQPDVSECKRIFPNMAPDCSVMYVPSIDRYLIVYTENGLSSRILARTASQPWGPWSKESVAFDCPEMSLDKRVFCYNGKAQPLLSQDCDLSISYVANSIELSQVAEDSSLYVPRFIRVKLQTAK